jgi:hypothetical protein
MPPKRKRPDHPVSVRIDDKMLWVSLQDGRVIGTPLEWYPWLKALTLAELMDYELSAAGIHWSNHDIDLSIEGMLKGINPAATTRLLDASRNRVKVTEKGWVYFN